MFRIKLNHKRKTNKPSPHFQNSVQQALRTVIVPKQSDADRGYYRPGSSQTRIGLATRAIGKPTNKPATHKHANGSNPRQLQNTKR